METMLFLAVPLISAIASLLVASLSALKKWRLRHTVEVTVVINNTPVVLSVPATFAGLDINEIVKTFSEHVQGGDVSVSGVERSLEIKK